VLGVERVEFEPKIYLGLPIPEGRRTEERTLPTIA
jgi:hypothetical protein